MSLERGVDDWVVCRESRYLVSRVEVDAVEVEDKAVHGEEEVNVHGHEERDHEQRRGTEELEEKKVV
jgi:hypothetical protein